MMITSVFSSRLTRFSVFCSVTLLLVAGVTGCSLPGQSATQEQANTADIPKPTAKQLLASLKKNFRDVNSFHVMMQVHNPGNAKKGEVQLRTADGDVQMPDKVQAQATALLSGQIVTIRLISIGNDQFITDPITGQWRVIKGVLDPRTLTNPDTGMLSLIGKMQKVSEPTADVANKVPCWRVTGEIDAHLLTFFTGETMPAGTLMQTNACIGKEDSLPYQLVVIGKAASGDNPDTQRVFLMSKFNQKIRITAPSLS